MTETVLKRQNLIHYLDQLLQPTRFRDYCPNGLQVEGTDKIRHLVTGVTANQALIEEAVALNADAILVHHGYFWKGEDPRLTGIKRERLKTLLAQDINLIAYHLPLDAHPELGNNAQLAQILELETEGLLDPSNAYSVGNIGRLKQPMKASDFAAFIGEQLDRIPLHIGEDEDIIETLAWCTGGAQGYLQLAVDAGVDAFITGEINEPAVHLARETGTHFFSAGHHATERYGAKAVGEHLAAEFGIQATFVDIDNPV
jgi:dinuclear metal center YbgI/SA1388 family protein